MSKIQEALKRIQGQGTPAPGADPTTPSPLRTNAAKRAEDTQTLAKLDDSVTLRTMKLEDIPEEYRHADTRYGGKAVEVDKALLESEGFLVSGVNQMRLADECRLIKRPILANALGEKVARPERANLVMVGSALPGEGKTFTCINLALSIAREKDWSVVLVDADCARQHLSTLFSADNEPGLLDILRDPELDPNDLIMPTSVSSLSILPAGTRDELAVELLSSERMTELADRWARGNPRRMFVFDSSPLLLTTEPTVLSGVVGQVALVVHAGHTSHANIKAAIEKLDPNVAVNAILNQAEIGLGAHAGGYYGYYGHQDDAAAVE